MRKTLALFCLLIVALNCFGESKYTYDLTKDIIIGTVSVGLTASSFFIDNSPSSGSDKITPSKDNVNAFDRNLTLYKYNNPLSVSSDIITYGLLALPVVSVLGNYKDANAWITYGVMYAESVLLVYGTTETIKSSVVRYRPYFYYDNNIPSGDGSDYYKSFPSRHAAFAFMSAGFLTSTFFTEYPDSPWKIPLCAVSYTLATGISAARIFSGNHFLSDVLVGAAIGSVYGYLIPWLHLRKDQDKVSIEPLPNGLMVSLKF